jgi:protein-arginine deiminase
MRHLIPPSTPLLLAAVLATSACPPVAPAPEEPFAGGFDASGFFWDGGGWDAALPPPPQFIDLVVDNNRNGILDPANPSEEADEDTPGPGHGAIFLANWDDDDGDGVRDSEDTWVNGEADLEDLAPVLVRAWSGAPPTVRGVLLVDEVARPHVRLHRAGAVAGADAYRPEEDLSAVPLSAEEVRLGVRFGLEGLRIVEATRAGSWDGTVTITYSVLPEDGGLVGQDKVRLRVAPLVFQYNTAPTEAVFYPDLGADSRKLAAGITAMSAGSNFTPWPLDMDHRRLEEDPWAQDYFDVASMTRPGPGGAAVGMKVAIKSPQPDRKAGNVTTVRLLGPGWGAYSLVSRNPDLESYGYSLSSFGNWDVIPPYDKGEEHYPLGRNLWGQGETREVQPDPVYAEMVRAQGVQPAVVVDTTWLTVGHVDEVTSWVKSNTPRGWGLLTGSAAEARAMLLELEQQGHGEVRMFQGKRWMDEWGRETSAAISVSAVLSNADIMAASQNAQLWMDDVAWPRRRWWSCPSCLRPPTAGRWPTSRTP